MPEDSEARFELVGIPKFYSAAYVPRPVDEERILKELLEVCNNPAKGILFLTGDEGIGKSTLLTKILSDNASSQLLDRPTVVLWLNCHKWRLGRDQEQSFDDELLRLANSHDYEFVSSNPVKVGPFFDKKGKRVLYVLDGLNNAALLQHFLQGQPDISTKSICLISSSIIMEELDRKTIEIIPMSEQQIVETMSLPKQRKSAPLLSLDQIAQLSRCCFGFPLIAKLMTSRLIVDDYTTVVEKLRQLTASSCNDQQKAKKGIICYLFDFIFAKLPCEARHCCYALLFFEPEEPVSVKDLEILSGSSNVGQLLSASLVTKVDYPDNPSPLFAKKSESNIERCVALHPELYEAALQKAIIEYSLQGKIAECLQQIRMKLVKRELTIRDGPQEIAMFDALQQNRSTLCKRFVSGLSVSNLAMCCRETSVKIRSAPTLLGFLYENCSWTCLYKPYKKLLARRVTVSEQLFKAIALKLQKASFPFTDLPEVRNFHDSGSIYNGQARKYLFEQRNWGCGVLERSKNSMEQAIVRNDEEMWLREFEASKVKSTGKMQKRFSEAALAAARCGNRKALETLHRNFSQCVMSAVDEDSLTVTGLAAKFGHLNVVQFLADEDRAVLSHRHKYSQTPIMYAAEYGHLPVVEFIVQIFPNAINQETSDRVTPIMFAARNGYLDIVKFLVAKDKAVASHRDRDGISPLMYATIGGYLDVVRYLAEIDAKAVSEHDSKSRTTPLMLACSKGYVDIAKFIIELNPSTLSHRNQYGTTPLMFACENDHLDIVKLIVEIDTATLSQHDTYWDMTPAMYAASYGCRQIVDYIIQMDRKSATEVDKKGKTPLMYACENGFLEIVQRYAELDSKLLSMQDSKGKTALMFAAEHGYHDVVEFLLESDKASVSQRDVNTWTPLMFAATYGQPEACMVLIQEGADVDAVNSKGNTALMEAISCDDEDPLCEHCVNWLLTCPMKTLNHRNYKGEMAAGLAFTQFSSQLGSCDNLINLNPKEAYLICIKLLQAGGELHYDPVETLFGFGFKILLDGQKVTAVSVALEMRQSNSINLVRTIQSLRFPENEALNVLRSNFPRTLIAHCRTTIVKRLPSGLKARQQAINSLPLPELLKQYLNYSEFEESGMLAMAAKGT